MAEKRMTSIKNRILGYGETPPRSADKVIESLKLVERGLLIGLPSNGFFKTLYPSWQFGSDGQLLPGFTEILGMTPKDDPWGVADILTSPQRVFGGRTPIEMLRDRKEERDSIVRRTIDMIRFTYDLP